MSLQVLAEPFKDDTASDLYPKYDALIKHVDSMENSLAHRDVRSEKAALTQYVQRNGGWEKATKLEVRLTTVKAYMTKVVKALDQAGVDTKGKPFSI